MSAKELSQRLTICASIAFLFAFSSSALNAGQGENSTAYVPVTDQRLVHPEPGDWLMYRRTYDGSGYSPLKQINGATIKDLVPVWTFSTGVNGGHEAAPVVNSGIMYVTSAYNKLFALEAKTGKLLWKYERDLPEDALKVICCDVVNRGVALYGDRVYMGTLDAHLLALDARSGNLIWDEKVADYKRGSTITSSPLIVKGKVITGIAGAEFGVRGFLAAYDADTGKRVWQTYTIPQPGEKGGDTWQGDSWKHGGGSTWITGTYDPELNLVFWGVGNPGPWIGAMRPGDNLYTCSTVALDPDSGAIKFHYQYTPHDVWDYDGVNEAVLVGANRNGAKLKGLITANRNGFFYLLDRTTGAFVYGKPFTTVTTFKGLDEKSGKPIPDPDHVPSAGHKVDTCPGLFGGKNWMPLSYSPDTGLAYVPTNHWCMSMSIASTSLKYEEGKPYIGDEFEMHPVPNIAFTGEFQAIDVSTGKQAWSRKYEAPLWSGVLSTAGSLVFTGTLIDRDLMAFDARNGDVLWHFRTNSGIVGVPVTYEIDGVQYIAVLSGMGGGLSLFPGAYENQLKQIPQGGVIWVFALKR
jgi:alcohol dehydrogenase (cytochrome c)